MNNPDDDIYIFREDFPIPLVTKEQILLQRAKTHSAALDEFLGFKISEVETIVRAKRFSAELEKFETWSHLPAPIFLTPYTELRYILKKIAPTPNDTVVDLGCAYARIPFVLARFHPRVSFIGIDCVGERIVESQRVATLQNIENSFFSCADISDLEFQIPKAQHYFIYDTGTRSDLEKILEKLKIQIAKNRQLPFELSVKSLILRGARSLDIAKKEHPWLPEPLEVHQNFFIFKFL